MRAKTFGRPDHVGNIQIGFDDGPEIHHGLGQNGLVHLVMDLVLDHTFHVLESA